MYWRLHVRWRRRLPREGAPGFQSPGRFPGETSPPGPPAAPPCGPRRWSVSSRRPDSGFPGLPPPSDLSIHGISGGRHNDIFPPPEKTRWSPQVPSRPAAPDTDLHSSSQCPEGWPPGQALRGSGRRNWTPENRNPGPTSSSSSAGLRKVPFPARGYRESYPQSTPQSGQIRKRPRKEKNGASRYEPGYRWPWGRFPG